jgi:hypothetical protein
MEKCNKKSVFFFLAYMVATVSGSGCLATEGDSFMAKEWKMYSRIIADARDYQLCETDLPGVTVLSVLAKRNGGMVVWQRLVSISEDSKTMECVTLLQLEKNGMFDDAVRYRLANRFSNRLRSVYGMDNVIDRNTTFYFEPERVFLKFFDREVTIKPSLPGSVFSEESKSFGAKDMEERAVFLDTDVAATEEVLALDDCRTGFVEVKREDRSGNELSVDNRGLRDVTALQSLREETDGADQKTEIEKEKTTGEEGRGMCVSAVDLEDKEIANSSSDRVSEKECTAPSTAHHLERHDSGSDKRSCSEFSPRRLEYASTSEEKERGALERFVGFRPTRRKEAFPVGVREELGVPAERSCDNSSLSSGHSSVVRSWRSLASYADPLAPVQVPFEDKSERYLSVPSSIIEKDGEKYALIGGYKGLVRSSEKALGDVPSNMEELGVATSKKSCGSLASGFFMKAEPSYIVLARWAMVCLPDQVVGKIRKAELVYVP